MVASVGPGRAEPGRAWTRRSFSVLVVNFHLRRASNHRINETSGAAPTPDANAAREPPLPLAAGRWGPLPARHDGDSRPLLRAGRGRSSP